MTPSLDVSAAYFMLALFGVLLSVYWSLTLARDPAMLHTPAPIVHIRRMFIMCIALSLLWSLTFAYDKSWEPWPPYVAIVLSIDMYLLLSIVSSILRRRYCIRCPLIEPSKLAGF